MNNEKLDNHLLLMAEKLTGTKLNGYIFDTERGMWYWENKKEVIYATLFFEGECIPLQFVKLPTDSGEAYKTIDIYFQYSEITYNIETDVNTYIKKIEQCI